MTLIRCSLHHLIRWDSIITVQAKWPIAAVGVYWIAIAVRQDVLSHKLVLLSKPLAAGRIGTMWSDGHLSKAPHQQVTATVAFPEVSLDDFHWPQPDQHFVEFAPVVAKARDADGRVLVQCLWYCSDGLLLGHIAPPITIAARTIAAATPTIISSPFVIASLLST
jgi:hypothetical protein